MRGQDVEAELTQVISSFRHDPLGFVLFAFPWGVPGTPLEKKFGPQAWQAKELIEIGVAMRTGNKKQRRAVASGKGIGKSALIAMTCLWGLSTFPNTRIRLTAGTEPQLRATTMPELAKWFRMMICKHWFVFTATSIYVKDPDPEVQKSWRLDAIPWNESNPEAFAGLHNQGSRIVYLFDEASQIADPIYDTSDGIMSDADTEVLWVCYGNPTRGIGRFKEAFGSPRWQTTSIDSRTVEITDKAELARQVEDYGGEDSDATRMFIRGLFPRVASTQFIPPEIAKAARKNEATSHFTDPLIMGVDVARGGQDTSVIAFRKGRDARSIPWKKYPSPHNQDTMTLSAQVAEYYHLYKADAVHVDGGGVGGGVVDRLRQLNIPVVEVQFGAKADRAQLNVDATRYANKRTEMWGLMRAALPTLAAPDSEVLEKDLTSALYGYRNDAEIQLVSKEIMKRQHGVDSPDEADALALTYAYPVQPKQAGQKAGGIHRTNDDPGNKALTEYDPFATA